MGELSLHDVVEIIYEVDDLSGVYVNRMNVKTKGGIFRIILFSKKKERLEVKKVKDVEGE